MYAACSIELSDSTWVTHVFHGKSNSSPLDSRFQILHTFVICDKLPNIDFFFGIDLQKCCSLSYYRDSDRHLFIKREGSFLTSSRNKEVLHNIALVKSTPKILPKHNGMAPIKIKDNNLQDQVEYFISNQHTKKEFDPNIHILNGIYNIKEKSTLYNGS